MTLQEEALRYFKNLFCDSQTTMPANMPTMHNPLISQASRDTLLLPVTMEEVTTALHQMHPYKSPGPDGFQGVFFRQYWDIIGKDIHSLIATAFSTGTFNPSLADTLIALIPKVDCPKNFKEFRPISLCNTVYKLLTKVLVNRIRPSLDQIIGPFQSSFLPGRGTSDNAIILQEVIHAMHKSKAKNGDVAYKIDLEKAYDHVRWDFLRNCLEEAGFPSLTVKLIMHCVTSSSLSIIWNGKRLSAFAPTRGLRQGDPLSPYLFVICMEKLSHTILEAVESNSWKTIQISRNGPALSHLFFADDVLIFSKATRGQAQLLETILLKFSTASGLHVNLNKSRALFSTGVSRRKKNLISTITSIRSTTSLEKYLGFPMLKGRIKISDFAFIVDKLQSRLASWKNRLLNKAGRITLAKSVLNSIPTYYMQIAWLPEAICSQIDKTTRDFIWKGTSNSGLHGVKWQTVTMAKKNGGLGVRRAREANVAMLGKLVWDVLQQNDKLWVNLISTKYVHTNNFINANKTTGSPIWNAISKARLALQEGFEFRIGNGASSLWYSPWTPFGNLSSQVSYVDIHDFDHTIADIIHNASWNFNDLYTSIPDHIKAYINNLPAYINDMVPDKFIWNQNLDGMYTVKAGYNWLLHRSLGNGMDNRCWSWIWKDYAPEKIKVLIWTACHESLPTAAVLHRRHMIPTPECPRCHGPSEDSLHILRDCPLSMRLWRDLKIEETLFYTNTNITLWLLQGVTSSYSNLFVAGIWWNWRARNTICIAKEDFPYYKLRIEVNRLATTIAISRRHGNLNPNVPRWVSWYPSGEHGIILNVDGSSLGNPGPSGMGGILRNENGDWLWGFTGHLGNKDNLFAELMALYKGLQLAWNRGNHHLKCYSDSLLAITLVQGPINNYHCYAVIIYNIRELLTRQWNVTLHHTLREGNFAADYLAKLGSSMESAWEFYEHPPVGMEEILASDARRIPNLRP